MLPAGDTDSDEDSEDDSMPPTDSRRGTTSALRGRPQQQQALKQQQQQPRDQVGKVRLPDGIVCIIACTQPCYEDVVLWCGLSAILAATSQMQTTGAAPQPPGWCL